MAGSELDRYLPTLERARAAALELPDGEPADEHKMAALIVLARAIRRESWDEVLRAEDVSDRTAPAPPGPPTSFELAVHSAVVGTADSVERGYRRVTVRHYTDRPVSLQEMYVPTLPAHFAFESALEGIAQHTETPPEILRCHDLAPREIGNAYRGGGRVALPDFHGYGFGDTIDKGKKAVRSIGTRGSVFGLQVAAYAWPFLWLRYLTGEIKEVIVAPDRAGNLHAIMPPSE
ncbi:MAG: hypothetical protein ACOC1F_12255 [Myxococcota bacterium]